MSSTMKKMKDLTSELSELRDQHKVFKDKASEVWSKIVDVENELIERLEADGLNKLSVPGVGTVSKITDLSVRFPKDPDARKKTVAYLKKMGVAEDFLTVNANTFKSFYKTEYENNVVTDGKADWEMPGVEQPEVYFRLSFRRS